MVSLVAIVEDDVALRDQLRRGLESEGFDVLATGTGAELLERVQARRPDVVAIDIGLPDADGRDVCQALRAAGVDAPVLFLTARAALSDRISGFHMGGDDYLVKPFAFDELVVRLRALTRRGGAEQPEMSAGMRLDPSTHAVHVDGDEVALTPTEFRIVAAMAARPGEVIRRSEIVNAAWPTGGMVSDNTLDSYIARIRRKLRTNGSNPIATVHGVGYRLE
jgi:two-component system OmpR family response regulator